MSSRSPKHVRLRRALVVGSVALLALTASGCEHYEPPCRVGAEEVLLDGVGSSGVLSLRGDGDTVASGFHYADNVIPSSPFPTGIEVAIITQDGDVAERHLVPAPSALVARKGSTDSIGGVWTGKGVVYYWVEKLTQTAADGSSSISSSLQVQFVSTDGQEGAFIPRPNGDCKSCEIRISAAWSPAGVSVLYAKVPSANSNATAPEQPDAGFIVVSVDGVTTATGSLPWVASTIGALASVEGALPRIENVAGTLVVKTERGMWAVDPVITPRAGPVSVLNAESAIALWDVERDDVVTVSARTLIVSPNAGNCATGTTASSVGEDSDLIFQRYTNSGALHGQAERISTGSRLESLAGADGHYGVVFMGGQSQYFAFLDAAGNKIGGDIEIGTPLAPIAAGGSRACSRSAEVLSAGGRGRFVRLSFAGGRIGRREIICAQ